MNLDSKLTDWQKHNLISAYQKQAILDYEIQVKRPLLYYSLLFLSSFCISIGILSLIAANWDKIPPSAKLICDYIFLLGLGAGVYFSKKSKKPYLYESLLNAFALLILASIGLIGQIYNLPPEGLKAVLFWAGLTFPLIFFTKFPLFPGLWMLGFFCSIFDLLYRIPDWRYILEFLFENHPSLGFCLTLTLLLYLRQGLNKIRQSAILSALQLWFIILICFFALWLDIIGNDWQEIYLALTPKQWLIYGIMLLAFLLLWKVSAINKSSYGFIGVSILYAYTLLTNLFPKADNVFSAIMIIALLAVGGIYAYQNHKERLFKVISVLLALRFFGIYCEVFGSLLTTGIGLIISGIIFLSIAWYTQKLSTRFLQSMKGNTNV